MLTNLGCARGGEGGGVADSIGETELAVNQVLRDFERAELAEDLEAVASLFTEDMVLARSTLPDIVGREAFVSVMEGVYAEETVVGVEIDTHGTVILGEWALSSGTDSVAVVPADGEPFSVKDDHVIVFHREGDGWKISRFINSLGVLPRGLLKELEKLVSEERQSRETLAGGSEPR
jgi:uncharacterized protein (TIGR02246 family)